ncbi:Crp/Fnr family transcriptional regulator [uncultured Nocardioides sp.]|uniref:Crp/Fnr family transcriptional regulator n=1 Tax=uncultured Nocardioides sp. TaxID=198441 RepID=UPI0026227272|nr:Crp/Fnr family transcriptional regulator [uncultured Nocardioides sp.]
MDDELGDDLPDDLVDGRRPGCRGAPPGRHDRSDGPPQVPSGSEPGHPWGWPGPGRPVPSSSPLLASLGDLERDAILAVARPRSFERGEVACHEGDPADSMHLVADGRFTVHVSLATGDTGMVNLLGPGDYFGELALLRTDRRRTATVSAIEPARTLVVTASAFRLLCAEHPAIYRTLAELLAGRVDALSRTVLELMRVSLDERVYRRLLELALGTPTGTDAGAPVVVPLTQAQLAELTGGTRPSVNRALRRLVSDGTVSLARGLITVHDLEALRRHCQLDGS